jgi:hypothetical protein
MFIADATINGRKDGFHTIGVYTTRELAVQGLETFLTMRWGEGGWYIKSEQYLSPHVSFGLNAGDVYECPVDAMRENAVSAAESGREYDLEYAARTQRPAPRRGE